MLNPFLSERCVGTFAIRTVHLVDLRKKNYQRTTGGNPYVDPLAARNRIRFPITSSVLEAQLARERDPTQGHRSL